mgnify:CR=1 FL=1
MKLYLSGGGSGKQNHFAYINFFRIIDKSKPILYIPLAMESTMYKSCYNWFKNEINSYNFNKFEMVKSSLELSKLDLNNYSALFIGGGNTYKLLSELKENDNINKIKKYLLNGGIVYGGSAGAIIFGKDIDGCKLMDEKNDVNTEGLNFINNYSLLCHFNNNNLKLNKKYLTTYSIKNKLLFLPEEDVLVINDNSIKIIGSHKYAIFDNQKMAIHSPSNFKKDIKSDE